MHRRKFIQDASVGLAFANLFNNRLIASPLQNDTDYLDLPEGFHCTLIDKLGDPMNDGFKVPGLPDGMACFPGESDDTFILVRNHEVSFNDLARSPYHSMSQIPEQAYKPSAMGGVTRILFDARTRKPISKNLVLAGTVRNCAGGQSPWGWMSCEETVVYPHGYTFLCDPHASSVQAPVRIDSYGRFNHEACVVQAESHIAFLTEDQADGCFYRFVPTDSSDPFVGQLQALAAKNHRGLNTAGMKTGDHIDVIWIDITQESPNRDRLRHDAKALGAAVIRRGEGLWLSHDEVYFSSTNGGPKGRGQIFKISQPTKAESRLEVIAHGKSDSQLDMPDNLTISPRGNLFICEDGGGNQYIRVLNPEGKLANFARNSLSASELAGVCFAPDGNALFVNIQHNNLTLMVTGPFEDFENFS